MGGMSRGSGVGEGVWGRRYGPGEGAQSAVYRCMMHLISGTGESGPQLGYMEVHDFLVLSWQP